MIKIGSLAWCNRGWPREWQGWFKVLDLTPDGGKAICKRIMMLDGTGVANSKLRPEISIIDLNLVTPEVLDRRREAFYKDADDDYKYLMDWMNK